MSEDIENTKKEPSREKLLKEGNYKEKLQRYETTVRWRVDCEEKAFHIVNKLIDGCVDPQYLMECGKFISKDNYGDIVEERAISNLCGYPLCEGELKNIPKQKFHISTKSNKVYDITERKNFCSNQCLKASKAFQSQIPDSPVSAGAYESTPVFTLHPHKSVNGIIGTEVVGLPPRKFLESEMESLKELDSKKTLSAKKDEVLSQKRVVRGKSSPKESLPQGKTSTLIPKDKSDALSSDTKVISDLQKLTIKENMSSFSDDVGSLTCMKDSASCHKEPTKICRSRGKQNIGKNMSDIIEVKNSSERDQGKIDSKSNLSQLERLNLLLSKKKGTLSGMMDVQEVVSFPSMQNISSTQTPETDSISQSNPTKTNPFVSLESGMNVADITQSTSSGIHASSSSVFDKAVPDTSDSQKLSSDINFKTHVQQTPLQRICQMLQPWVTDITKEHLKSSSSTEIGDENTSGFSDPKIQTGYMNLCKRLDLQEQGLHEDALEEVTIAKAKDDSSKLQSVPDYQRLREEAEQFQIKVTEFITGRRAKDTKSDKSKKDAEDENPVFLPTVDIYDQNMIRAKIVLDRLNKTVPDLLVPMGLTVQDVSTSLRELIYTFRLERDNIIFKPAEWTLIALILLKMLALKVRSIDCAFQKDTTINYLKVLLHGIGQNYEDLTLVVDCLLH